MATNFSLEDLGITPGMTGIGSSYNPSSSLGSWFSNNSSMLIGAGLSALSGYANARNEASQTAEAAAQSYAEQQLMAKNRRQLTADEYATDYYYNRLNKERKRKGLSTFRQFKSGYAQDSTSQE